jgi:hypothetical protein
MGGMRFAPFHVQHAVELGSNQAELYYENLKFHSVYAGKDGWFSRTASQIEADINQKRYIQDACRKILVSKSWIVCRLDNKRPPTICFRVLKTDTHTVLRK